HTRFKCDWSSDVCSSDLVAELRPRVHREDKLAHLDEPAHRREYAKKNLDEVFHAPAPATTSDCFPATSTARRGSRTRPSARPPRSEERRVGKEGQTRRGA